jgi:hypothetical protein
MGHKMGGGGLGMMVSVVFWLLHLVLLVAAVVWLFGGTRRG